MRRLVGWAEWLAVAFCATAAIGAPASAAPQWVTPNVEATRVRQLTFRSSAVGATVSYFVYVPEGYDAEKTRRFPVLYWLHGTGGGLYGLPILAGHFDAAIRDGKIPPMLVVFPNGLESSLWVDSKDGRAPVERMVIRDLVPEVDRRFRTIAKREGRMVEGFSMGGYGAARLAFKYPALFGAVSIVAGGPLQREFTVSPRAGADERARVLNAVFGGDLAYFREQSPWELAGRNAAALRTTRIRVLIGDRDTMLAVTRAFDARLSALRIPHEFHVVPGVEHQPLQLLLGLGEDDWRFYRKAFGPVAPAGGR